MLHDNFLNILKTETWIPDLRYATSGMTTVEGEIAASYLLAMTFKNKEKEKETWIPYFRSAAYGMTQATG